MKKFQTKDSKYAVVTGASTGLGRCIAIELAKRKINTILTALPGENLEETSRICRSFGTESEFFEFDMTDKTALVEFAWKVNGKYDVYILVNNAGTGGSRRFDEVPINYIDTIIQLNVAATAILTHEFLPNLRKNARSCILNICSMAGQIPTGYKTVYPASKAFIKHFSLGMRAEFKPFGVSVSYSVIGPMLTKPEIIERINRQGLLGKSLALTPEKVAGISVKGMLRGRRTIVPGKLNHLSYMLLKPIPEHIRGILMSRSVRKNEL